MTLSASQLADLVDKAKTILGIEDDDEAFSADGIAVYGDDGVLASATVEVTATTVILVDDVTGTSTLTMADADKDTLEEMVTAINAVANWTATLLGYADAASNLLIRKAETSCLGAANEQVLRYENQYKLELLITNTFASIERYLNRSILSASFSEIIDYPMSSGTIVMDEPDVTQVTGLSMEVQNGLTCKYTGSDTNARVEVTDTAVVLTSLTDPASPTSTTILFTDQATTTLMAAAITAVGGWTGTVSNAGPSAYLVRQGVRDAKDTTVTLEAWDDHDGDYEVDYGAGVITLNERLSSARSMVRVDYVAGLSSIPSDLEGVILSGVKVGWDVTSKDSSVQSERLGDYAYTLSGDSGATAAAGGLSDNWFAANSQILARYARIRP